MKFMEENEMALKTKIRNASIAGALLTGGLAVTTVFCSKHDDKTDEQSSLPAGIGAWSFEATDKSITINVDSCVLGHMIYCEYEISKYNNNNIQAGSYTSIKGTKCTNAKMEYTEKDPCSLAQGGLEPVGNANKASAYHFEKIKCYDTSLSNKELILTKEIPKIVTCK